MNRVVTVLVLLAASSAAFGWDCQIWSQSTNPTGECYKPPSTGSTSSATAASTQSQQQSQHQGQSQTATGGNATASNAGNQQVTQFSSQEIRQAPSVIAGTLVVPQCASGAGAGGSGPGGSLFANLIWTPHDCKILRVAGALQAIGMLVDACRMITHTDALISTYRDYGLPTPDCEIPVAGNPVLPSPGTYTRKQVDEIVQRVLRK